VFLDYLYTLKMYRTHIWGFTSTFYQFKNTTKRAKAT